VDDHPVSDIQSAFHSFSFPQSGNGSKRLIFKDILRVGSRVIIICGEEWKWAFHFWELKLGLILNSLMPDFF